MKILFHPGVYKQLQGLPRTAFAAVLRAIVARAHQSRPVGAVPLVGSKGAWRIRVGEYRVLYVIDDVSQIVTVYRVGHRRDVYR